VFIEGGYWSVLGLTDTLLAVTLYSNEWLYCVYWRWLLECVRVNSDALL